MRCCKISIFFMSPQNFGDLLFSWLECWWAELLGGWVLIKNASDDFYSRTNGGTIHPLRGDAASTAIIPWWERRSEFTLFFCERNLFKRQSTCFSHNFSHSEWTAYLRPRRVWMRKFYWIFSCLYRCQTLWTFSGSIAFLISSYCSAYCTWKFVRRAKTLQNEQTINGWGIATYLQFIYNGQIWWLISVDPLHSSWNHFSQTMSYIFDSISPTYQWWNDSSAESGFWRMSNTMVVFFINLQFSFKTSGWPHVDYIYVPLGPHSSGLSKNILRTVVKPHDIR